MAIFKRNKIKLDERARYMLLVEKVMKDLMPKLEKLSPPVVFKTFFGDFAGSPNNMAIWFAFDRQTDKNEAEANGLFEQVRHKTIEELRRHNYPESAFPTLFIGFTSKEEIDAGGGTFAYFR